MLQTISNNLYNLYIFIDKIRDLTNNVSVSHDLIFRELR